MCVTQGTDQKQSQILLFTGEVLGDVPDDGEAVEGAAGVAGVVDKEVMVMLQFWSRRYF